MDELVAVVPAGGKGTRLSSVTGALPKSLAQVRGKPFLHLQLRHLRDLGVDRVHLSLGYGAEEIIAAAADGVPSGLAVTHTVEDEPLGVIGAVRLALPQLPPRFLMTYGDVLVPPAVDALWHLHETSSCEATVLVANATDESNIELTDSGSGPLVSFYGKGGADNSFVDIGLCALDASCVAGMPGDRPVGEADLFTSLIARRGLGALPWPEKSLHIGDPEHLSEVESWAEARERAAQSESDGATGTATAGSHAARTWRE